MSTIFFCSKESGQGRYKSTVVLFTLALLFIFGHKGAMAQGRPAQPAEWIKIDVDAFDFVEIMICADEACPQPINLFSARLCTPTNIVCNFPVPNDHYKFACTERSCMLQRPYGDQSLYKLRIDRNGHKLTSDVQRTGNPKVASAKAEQLILQENRGELDKRSNLWRLWGLRDGNFFWKWPLIPIIKVLSLLALFRLGAQWRDADVHPLPEFWFIISLVHMMLYFVYAFLFNALEPLIDRSIRVGLLSLLPVAIGWLFITVWFNQSKMSKWPSKILIAIGVAVLTFVYLLISLLVFIHNSMLPTLLLSGLPVSNAIGLVFIIAVFLEAFLYRVIDRKTFTQRTALYMSIFTNGAIFGMLIIQTWLHQ